MQSKKQIAQAHIHAWQNTLLCPHCHQPLIENDFHLKCMNNHTFDISKQGYINLAPQHIEQHYDQSLFTARHQVMNQIDLYHGLHEQLAIWLTAYNSQDISGQKIVDLGTGEGTHLAKFIQALDTDIEVIGLDLAKDGIMTAAKNYTEALWIVANLSKMPFVDHSIDGGLTILSPSNYTELKRILKAGGWFIKVIPGKNYLRELREIVLPSAEVSHDNQESVVKFEQAFKNIVRHQFSYQAKVNPVEGALVAQMTPLFWHASDAQMAEAKALSSISIELDVLIGQV